MVQGNTGKKPFNFSALILFSFLMLALTSIAFSQEKSQVKPQILEE
jgi:hypothetical protein